MEEQVPEDVIKARFDRLLKEVQKISAEKAGALTGQTLPVLIEEHKRAGCFACDGKTQQQFGGASAGDSGHDRKDSGCKADRVPGLLLHGERADGKGQTVMKKRISRNDVIFLAILHAVVTVFLVIYERTGMRADAGACVRVTVDGSVVTGPMRSGRSRRYRLCRTA